MAIELLEPLVGFFCPTNEAASACREFISNHSQVLPPIGPLFYFLLFPIVFTILFIYILSSTILHGGNLTKGMKLLIGVSVFIFIIINGWYPAFLILSEFWFIAVILLFGVYYFVTKHWGGGKAGGGLPGLGGESLFSVGIGTLKKRTSGELSMATSEINSSLQVVQECKNELKRKADKDGRALMAYDRAVDGATAIIQKWDNEFKSLKIPGIDRSTYKSFILNARKRLEHIQKG